MDKIILCLVGPISSGKGTVKDYLVKKYKAKDCRFSDSFRDILNRLFLPISRENMQKVSTILRQSFGADLLARVIAEDAKKLEADVVVVDGARRVADLLFLEKLPGYVLVGVDATVENRYQRVVARNENTGDRDKTFEDFLKNESAETEIEIPTVMKSAKLIFDNNGSLENLFSQIDVFLQTLEK